MVDESRLDKMSLEAERWRKRRGEKWLGARREEGINAEK